MPNATPPLGRDTLLSLMVQLEQPAVDSLRGLLFAWSEERVGGVWVNERFPSALMTAAAAAAYALEGRDAAL